MLRARALPILGRLAASRTPRGATLMTARRSMVTKFSKVRVRARASASAPSPFPSGTQMAVRNFCLRRRCAA